MAALSGRYSVGMTFRALAAAAALIACSSLDAAGSVRGVWRDLPPLPSPRQEVAVTVLGEEVYVLGGLTPGGATNGVAVLDTRTGGWSEGPALPRVLHHGAAATVDGRVYSIGGFLGTSFSPTSEVFRLDPQQGGWDTVAPLPAPRGALAAAVIDGRIYAAGGNGPGGGDTASLFRYHPATDQWETLAPMPTPRNHHAAAAIDGRLYVVAGRRFASNLPALEIYDPATGRWETGPPLPTARSGIAAVNFRGLLFVLGGEIPVVFDEVEVFDPAAGAWFALTPMPLPRHGIGAAVVGNRILVPGGATVVGFGSTAMSDELLVLDQLQVLAQFADSRQIVSQLLASNYGMEEAQVLVEARDGQGGPLNILPGGASQTGFTLQPGETRNLTTAGAASPPGVGFAMIFSDRPLLAHVLFSSDFGFAGVLGLEPLERFGVPVQRNAGAGLDSGVALATTSAAPCTIDLMLLDTAGAEVATAALALPALGQQARFLDQLFAGADLDAFEGSLLGEAGCPFGAMAILVRGDQFATLPVQALTVP